MSRENLPIVSINIAVLNGEKYIRHCLERILAQTYPKDKIEINIIDNGSTDNTKRIIKEVLSFDKLRMPIFNFIESKLNMGMWPGQEELLKCSNGKYIIVLSVDVLLDFKFIEEAVKILEADAQIGAIEPKIYRFEVINDKIKKTNIIDTCGFKIFKSRRVVNIGHGEEDRSPFGKAQGKEFDFNREQEIFAVEGAVPIFRREALESCKIKEGIIDRDMFWYGDDLDLAWRMRLFKWKQIYSPNVIAYHDRQTTHTLKKDLGDFIKIRRTVPKKKRRLDYRNTHMTIIKNDHLINFIKDLPYFLKREISLWIYFLIYEPFMLLEIFNIIKLMPKMIRKRREIMEKSRVSAKEMHKWFN